MPTASRAAYFAWLIVCVVWGTTYLAIRIALETIPPFLMTGFRWMVAGTVLLAAMRLRGQPVPRPRDWPAFALIGVLLMGFGNGGVVWAEQVIPSGLAAVLVAVVPLWMVGVDRMMGDGEPLSRRRLAGLLVGFAGIVLLVWPEIQLGEGPGFLLGVGATQLATLGWALGSSYARRRRGREHVLVSAAMQMVLGGVCILAFATARGEWGHLAFSARTTLALLHLIVIGSIVGFTAYAYALAYLPVATVSTYAYVNPIIAVLLGTVVLGEPLSVRLAIAGAIVLVGMGMVREA
jgi:drug/metabolite transporter (DMT)-like permease